MQFDKKPTRISNADANSTSAARMSVTDRMNMRTIFTNEEFQFVSTAADSKERTSTTSKSTIDTDLCDRDDESAFQNVAEEPLDEVGSPADREGSAVGFFRGDQTCHHGLP
ncbi:uncharacterized protein LOC116849556 [Odontomachus brunneus]|uniref:uncharacterized protein LOC116849556 n=1 Tax=Odontomachus brunneus TaxID=486640 RepID=UPI0013F1B797|nr:uncharacterized protein LOC116849556 [Odontomachus brunneus]